jgi:hypothetical protein
MALAPSEGLARAEHDMMSEHHHGDASEVSLGLAVEAAEFDTRFYVGSYQAIAPSVSWMRGRFGANAMVGLYHITENGLSSYGAGDAMVTGHVAVMATDAMQAGVALHLMFPTGSETEGLGMGHAMAMPSAWAHWQRHWLAIRASAGYGRALTSLGGHHHGPAPLVDPMNMQELTWSAGAELDVGHGMRVGGHALGGVPVATSAGVTRVIGAGRVAWGTSRVSTGIEVQVGLAGDPFSIRGVVDTALRF